MVQSHMLLTASPYMTKYLRISSYIGKPFLIYDFAPDPFWIFFIYEENFISFLAKMPILLTPGLKCSRTPRGICWGEVRWTWAWIFLYKYYFWMGLTVLFGSGNFFLRAKQGFFLGRVQSSVEATEQLQIIRSP
jgi:hypothetical protein